MFKLNQITLVMAALCYSSLSFAAFTYQGQPISPGCISQLVDIYNEPKSEVSLQKCHAKNTAMVNVKDDLVTTRTDSEQLEPFTSYQIIGQSGDKYLLVLTEWGGGSGVFTTIVWLRKTNTHLVFVKTLSMGDRCNGGVEKVGAWQYSVNLTPAAVLDSFGKTKLKIKPYDVLSASASSCVAKAIYTFNPKVAKAKLDKMILVDEAQDVSAQADMPYQACFNQLFNGYVVSGNRELNQGGVDYFIAEFTRKCIKEMPK